ncbi:hypothetical protein ACGFOW_03715 [Streptomyces rubiginosohelvolus]|uniref:hypothetical protein n=1 Tax=Streptomyces rubiginosohelvolus TaxID=67362 RepID=UPI00371610F9
MVGPGGLLAFALGFLLLLASPVELRAELLPSLVVAAFLVGEDPCVLDVEFGTQAAFEDGIALQGLPAA